MVTNVLISGSIAGLIAIAFGTILDYYLFRIGIMDNNISVYVSAILLRKEFSGDRTSKYIGLIGHLIMSILFGIIISLTLYLTGYRYSYFKGIFIGGVFWLILHQALTEKFWVPIEYNISSKGVLWQFIIHLFEGFVTVFFIKLI
ncbi:hypothetical protein JCM15765_38970 [Paradesulfitobacterium aromaticivorans]